jgi:hypothetical protein
MKRAIFEVDTTLKRFPQQPRYDSEKVPSTTSVRQRKGPRFRLRLREDDNATRVISADWSQFLGKAL